MLMARGLKPGECPEAWSLNQPEALSEIARLYLEAGADLIETNTFGASPLKLSHFHLEDDTEAINREAVLTVRPVVDGRAYLVASIGPCGRMLQPYGDTPPEVIYESFCRQMRALAGAGIDAFCIETMTDLNEAVLAVKAAKSVAPAIPVIATMTFDRTRRGFFTLMGVTVAAAAKGLATAGADIIGGCCGTTPAYIQAFRRLVDGTCRP